MNTTSPSSTLKTAGSSFPNPWRSFAASIERIRAEIPSVFTFQLRFHDPEMEKGFRFRPGQFNMIYLPGCGEVAISLSGSSELHEGTITHTIRAVGRVTQAMESLRVGDTLGIRGPYGSAWPIEQCEDRDVVIVSGGLGLAPLRPLIYQLLSQRLRYRRLVLLHGARSPDLILYREELESWEKSGMMVQQTVDQPDESWTGQVGVVPLLIDRLHDLHPENTTVVMCGPEVMMHYSALSVQRLGIPVESIWLSLERNMQCAVGLCGHCQLGPHFVCKQGPVFRYDAVADLLKVRDL